MTTSTRTETAVGTYRIDPERTAVAFTVRELFGLVPVRGRLAVAGGTVTVAEDPRCSSVRAEIEVASLRTGIRRRDADLASKRFLDAARYPTMTFTSTAVEQLPGGGWQVRGALAYRDVTAEVVLALAEHADGRFRATTRIDRYAYGVTAGKGFIARYLDVTLDVTTVRSTG
jgi:polyisoprenoid-binding protein YceI